MQTIQTPAFVLEEEKLIKNLKLLSSVEQQSGAKVLMALKAFSMHQAFPLIREYLTGAAISSLNEALLVQEYWGDKSFVYSPVYTEKEIIQYRELASHLVFNSIAQLGKYKSLLPNISLGLRINPEVSDIKVDMYNPSSSFSRLGVPISAIKELPLGVEGIHIHALCENDVTSLIKVVGIIEDKFARELHQLKWINLGGGHAITRKDYDVKSLIDLLLRLRKKYKLEVYIEPGSAVAWESGYLLSTILDIVPTASGEEVAILDCSFVAHMPDCLEMPYKPHVESEFINGEHKYIFGGTTCLAGDQVSGFSFNKRLEIGDRVKFLDMMHYTMVKTNHFNGVIHPNIYKCGINSELKLHKSYNYNSFRKK